MHRVLAALLGALLFGPLAAHAGFLIVDENGEQVLLSTGRLKMAPRSAGGLVLMLDVGRGRLWVADPGRRRYWEGTVDEYCEGVRGLAAASTPDAEKSSGGSSRTPQVTIERTPDTATIAGLPTRKVRVLADGTLYEELWLASDPALLGELIVARAPDTFGRMTGCLSTAGRGRGVEATEEFRRLYSEGWPLKVVFHGDGSAVPVTAVARLERRDIPEGEFTRPAGFAAVSLPEVFGRAAP
jgi:hypothetical protein